MSRTRRLALDVAATLTLLMAGMCDPSMALAEDGLVVTVTGGAVTTLAGEAPTIITPTAFVEADGPLAIGKTAPLRLYTRIGITSEPGETPVLADVQTFKAAAVDLGAYFKVGEVTVNEQVVRTSVHCEWGFSSRIGNDPAPLERLVRHYGCGVRFDEASSKAGLSLIYGRDEAAGAFGYGQWMLYGQLPLSGKDGLLLLVGDATLAVGRKREAALQRDIFRLGVVLDLGAVLGKLR